MAYVMGNIRVWFVESEFSNKGETYKKLVTIFYFAVKSKLFVVSCFLTFWTKKFKVFWKSLADAVKCWGICLKTTNASMNQMHSSLFTHIQMQIVWRYKMERVTARHNTVPRTMGLPVLMTILMVSVNRIHINICSATAIYSAQRTGRNSQWGFLPYKCLKVDLFEWRVRYYSA